MASKLKGKEWFKIVAPSFFGDYVIGETIIMDPKKLKGRVIETSLMDIMGDPTKYYFKFLFKIVEINEKKAVTQFVGHTTTRDYLARIVRKRTSRIDTNDIIKLKDNTFRVKTVAVSNRRVSQAIKVDIRRNIREIVKKEISEMKTEEFVRAMIDGKIQGKVKRTLSKIYPLRHFEIRKTELM